MREYRSKFTSNNIERIIKSQTHKLSPELIEFVARTPNGNAIDYTHTIDISFEERRHDILKNLVILRQKKNYNIFEYKRLETIIKRLSSVSVIEHDLKDFLRRTRKNIDFDAFYIIPNENHVHILIVLYNGNIKTFLRKARKRPCCWDVGYDDFATTVDEYLENKVKYCMGKKNMNIRNYEEIVYDFYPNKDRLNAFFDRHRNMYEYRLQEMSR